MGSGVMPNGDSSQLAGGGRSPGWLLMLPVERDFAPEAAMTWAFGLERVTRIELALSSWEVSATVLA